MPFTIIRNDLAKMHVDVIVNSTRRRPIMGYATDRYLHEIAGPKMMDERKRYGVLETSQAIITKGYGLPSEYVIHTVGPTYSDGKQGEAQALFNTYMNVLELAKKAICSNHRFPAHFIRNVSFSQGTSLRNRHQRVQNLSSDIRDGYLSGGLR